VPSCAQFVDFADKWVGIDEVIAAEILGLPLYQLTDADIDAISSALRQCMAAAGSAQEKALLAENAKHIPSLRAARDRVRRAVADFDKAKARTTPKLEQIAAKVNALPPTPSSRAAVDDAAASVSAIFFELDQKRLRAQIKEPLTENYPAYGDAMAALARKHQAYAEESRKQLTALAADAFERHRDEFERLNLPVDVQEATIILEGVYRGTDVRWLTLRQWASLVLANRANQSASARQDTARGELDVEIVRPGYGAAEFGFRQDGRNLLLARSGVDGKLNDIASADARRQANNLLIEVARGR
jgi:molecular chaperone GrpE (heat shock protein)